MEKATRVLLSSVVALFLVTGAHAGGLLGDIINKVAPGVGTRLDDVHRDIKEAVPPYKAIEEGGSRVVNESLVQATAPLLQEAIARSRDDALRSGVSPIPPDIRLNLEGFIPASVLSQVRFRVKGGGDLSLQVNAIRYGEANAIALDYVVVFKNQDDALYNPALWAHELTHISQYQRWGIRDFAIRYVRDYAAVEKEAYEAETRYVAWAGLQNARNAGSVAAGADVFNRPIAALGGGRHSSTCGTAVGACGVGGSAPIGTPCWCGTPFGPATGSLLPDQTAQASTPAPAPPVIAPVSMGMSSGTGMQGCGCWGPTTGVAVEPRCQSGAVQAMACPGMCQMGGQPYGWVCR